MFGTQASADRRAPSRARRTRRVAPLLLGACVATGLAPLPGCAHYHARTERLPGETDTPVTAIEIVPAPGTPSVFLDELPTRLGGRKGTILLNERRYNPYRVAEDRRRVVTYLANLGYFDATAEEPQVTPDGDGVKLRYVYTAGPRYPLVSLDVRGVPPDLSLDRYLITAPGGDYALELLRMARYPMAEHLQRAGYGHAKVYVRHYVDRARRELHVVYFADPGPATTIGSITIDGNHKTSEADIRRRLGLRTGERFDLARRIQAENDLRDTGSFTSVLIGTTCDIDQYLGEVPDTGGKIVDERIGPSGELLPRDLSSVVDLVVHVDEAPRVQVQVRGTVEADLTRLDSTASAQLRLRDTPGSMHHLTLRGRVGVGYQWTDDASDAVGVYGDALVRYDRPGLLGRVGDAHLAVEFRDILYPSSSLRQLTAGPGLRATLAPGVLFDVAAYARLARQVGVGPFDDATRAEFSLPADDDMVGGELAAGLVWDARNDPVEASAGRYLALRGLLSPVGEQRYAQVAPEARGYLGIAKSWSLALRGAAAWSFELGDGGVPLGARLFGGGAWGMRGFGRDRMTPLAPCAAGATCTEEYVGGLSLVELSLEARFLPYRKQVGLNLFLDAGGAGVGANPLADGLNAAVGVGPRVRLWYLPISLDVGYRFLDGSELLGAWRGLQAFVRVGEAF